MLLSHPASHTAYVAPLTGIRALAALLVLGLHADQNVPVNIGSALPFLVRGYLGVDFFFVLSGYIITHVYLANLTRPTWRAARIFFWHRFIRLYPVHVAVLAGLIALIAAVRVAGIPLNNEDEWKAGDLVWQFTLLHAWGVTPKPGWNAPSWSISAEWFAYLLFPAMAVVLVRLRGLVVALGVAAAALAATAAAFAAFDWSINAWVGAPALTRVTGEFLCGAALCRAVAAGGGGQGVGGDVLGAAAFVAFLIGASAGVADFALIGFLALTVLGAATSRSFLAALLGSRLLVWLGEISYSIYMVHFPVLIVLNRLWVRLGFPGWGMPAKIAAFAFTVALVIGCAALLFYAVERPCRTRWRDRMGRLESA